MGKAVPSLGADSDTSLYLAYQPAPAARRIHYERGRPEETVLYQLVQEHLETFLAQVELETGSRLHLIRFHGVLAPNAKHRSANIPNPPVNATHTAEVHGNTVHHSAPARISWARLLNRVFDIDRSTRNA